nr:helix-turn-helix transcriptional regulator [Roseospira goensis]
MGRGVRGRRDAALERSVGQRLRALREAAGVSREVMAARMGLTPAQLRKLEEAITIIPVAHLAVAARVLGVTVGDFYGGRDPLAAPAPAGRRCAEADPLCHPESRALLSAYYAAPESVRRDFASLLAALVRR